MEDIEKQRAEYVVHLETQLVELQRQLAEAKPLAEKWTPVIAGQVTPEEVRVTLSFGGKRVTVTVNMLNFATNSTQDLVSSIADVLCESLVVEKVREVIRPEIERLRRGVTALTGSSL